MTTETRPSSMTTPTHAPPSTPPARQDTSSSSGSGPYSPIPEGRWKVPFHGNCPRCHHYHKAVQVKVNVGPDSSQVSYIHCEECGEKWGAFGGRSTTQISLLSDITTEPDPMETELRYSLVEAVKAATNVASLGGIAELPTYGISRQASHRSGAEQQSDGMDQSNAPSTSVGLEESTSRHQRQEARLPRVSTYPLVRSDTQAKDRSLPYQLASKLKRSVSARLSGSQKEVLRRLLPASIQPRLSARQLEKSPVRTPPDASPSGTVQPRLQVADEVSNNNAANTSINDFAVPGPSEPRTEVAVYIESLDKSGLRSMSEQERASWFREKLTAFKVRQRSKHAPLGFSPIFQTSIRAEPSGFHNRPPGRYSIEVRHAGTHFDNVDANFPHEVASRRSTISISDVNSEPPSVSDEANIAVRSRYSYLQQRVRRGLGPQRPRSLPNAPRSPPASHQQRNSVDLLRYNIDTGSNTSIQGQASQRSSRWSQNSGTLQGTVDGDNVSVSQSSYRRPSDEDVYSSEASTMPQPTPLSPPANHRNDSV
ncbi:hypothetical protein BKA63DRAFT_424781 [Paraphoma chrysanthemicola]|nr:hypothetical protein BKA63DRAFT_424781 [Paraphoma chrysanthemicola]